MLTDNQQEWMRKFDEYTVENPSVVFGAGLAEQVQMVKTFINVKGRFPSLANPADLEFIASVEDLLNIYQTKIALEIGVMPYA